MEMDTAFFRSFFVNNDGLSSPLEITPATFEESSPIVVTELNNSQAGEILGVSKVKGGNRYTTICLAAMCAVFRPQEGKCTIWCTV